MGLFGHWELLLILIVVLIILGPGKLPQIGGAIGGAIKEFRKSTADKAEVTPADIAAAPAEPKKESPEPTKV